MQQAAKAMSGTNDYRIFTPKSHLLKYCMPYVPEGRTSIKTISASVVPGNGMFNSQYTDLWQPGKYYDFIVKGDSFLYHQVRLKLCNF